MINRLKSTLKKLILLVLVLLVAYGCLHYNFYTSVRRPQNRYQKEVVQIKSHMDMDGDGRDDQSDILLGALDYVRTRPRYVSRYYQGGYPNDGCGVCTDLVASALRSAGYDLRELVSHDIENDPDRYGIAVPDANIDYRRVKNLRVYLYENALSKTTDLSKIEEWQGGDIVVFEDHIGIVSDRRNVRGVPYVIHHNGVFQKAFEQDILETRNDTVAHYRISE